MFKIGLKNLLAHRRRLAATGLAVLAGVAFLSGTLVFGDTARASFDDRFTDANRGTDAVVRDQRVLGNEDTRQRGLLDPDLVAVVASVEGVAVAEPVVEMAGQIVGADGRPVGGDGPPTVAGNWIEDPEVNPYRIVEGRAPVSAGEVVVNVGAADAGGLEVGSRTTVRTPAPVEVEIVGLATYGSAGGAGGATFVAFTRDAARRWLLDGEPGLTSIRLAGDDGAVPVELTERLATVLPDGVEAITGEELTAEQNEEVAGDFLDWFERLLLVFSGIALLVATFTIHNTFAIMLAQRTRESALLRAIGATRRQVLRSIAVESLVIGVVSSAVGVLVGVGLAQAMTGFVEADTLTVDPWSVVVAVSVGIGVTVLAGVVPAVRASRVAPVAALRDSAAERRSVSKGRLVLGGLLTVAGAGSVLVAAGTDGGNPMALAGLGAVAVAVGSVVLGPVLAGPLSRLIGAPLPRIRGVSGLLARQNAMRNPRRTAGAATALMIGVAVVSLFTVVAASVRSSLDATLAGAFSGDLVVTESGWSAIGFDPAMADDLAAAPEVAVATGAESAALLVDGEESSAAVLDVEAMPALVDFELVEGSFPGLGGGGIAVSETYAADRGLATGSTVEVGFVDGATADLTVGAVFAMTDLTGPIILPVEVWEPHADQRRHQVVLLSLAEGVGEGPGRTAVEEIVAGHGAGEVQDRDEFVETVAGELDQLLSIVYVLLALSIVIALVGIGNTLALSIHERTGELGLLRAVGQTRAQLRSMVRWESVIISVLGTVGGVGLGCFLAWGLVESVPGDWGGTFAVPVGRLGAVLAAGALVGVVAAIRPARRAARLEVLTAIRTE